MLNHMKLTPQEQQVLLEAEAMRQAQVAKNQQYWNLTNTTTTSTANTLGTAGTIWNHQLGQQWQAQPGVYTSSPPVDRLQTLDPGWMYVRWRKPAEGDAEAYAVPIIALAIRGSSVEYVLGEERPTMQPEKQVSTYTTTVFLAILAPHTPYDGAEWQAKARAAWYQHHAADVAARLLRSVAKV